MEGGGGGGGRATRTQVNQQCPELRVEICVVLACASVWFAGGFEWPRVQQHGLRYWPMPLFLRKGKDKELHCTVLLSNGCCFFDTMPPHHYACCWSL